MIGGRTSRVCVFLQQYIKLLLEKVHLRLDNQESELIQILKHDTVVRLLIEFEDQLLDGGITTSRMSHSRHMIR